MAEVLVKRREVGRQVDAVNAAATGLKKIADDLRGRPKPAAPGLTGRPSSEAALNRFLETLGKGLEKVEGDLVEGGHTATYCMTQFSAADRRQAAAYAACVTGRAPLAPLTPLVPAAPAPTAPDGPH